MLFFLQGNISKKNCTVTTAQRKEIMFLMKFADDNVMSRINVEGINTSCREFQSLWHVYPLDCPGPLPNMLLCKLIRNMSSYHNLLAYTSQTSTFFFLIFPIAAGCHEGVMGSKKRRPEEVERQDMWKWWRKKKKRRKNAETVIQNTDIHSLKK